MPVAIVIHVLSAVIWVGGMFFAYMILRPTAAALLSPPQPLMLWAGVFQRFFPWVRACVALLLLSGGWIIFQGFGGFARAPGSVHIMTALGLVMTGLFIRLDLGPGRQLSQQVANEDWAAAQKSLGRVRHIVAVNLSLGLITSAVAAGGRYWQ